MQGLRNEVFQVIAQSSILLKVNDIVPKGTHGFLAGMLDRYRYASPRKGDWGQSTSTLKFRGGLT